MSLWADYIAELRGPDFRKFLEYPDCFAAYSVPPDLNCIIIHDMYVKPELRETGRGTALLTDICEIGRTAGKSHVIAELELGTRTAEVAFRAQTAAGFIPRAAHNGIIHMEKEL